MLRTFMLSVSAMVMIYAATAAAQSPRPTLSSLTGTYGFTSTQVCLFSRAGFDSSFQAIGTNVWSSSFSVEGIWTFNGNGTGTAKASNMGITVPPTPGFQPGASSVNSSYSFTYTVNANRTFQVDAVPGTFTGTAVTGTRAGQTQTIVNLPTLTGLISRNGNTLTFATLDPRVQTSTWSNGDILPQLCQRSGVLIKLQSDDDR